MRVIMAGVLAGLLGGCKAGPAGPPGEQGERGEQGPPGAGGYWWVDAAGTKVAPYGDVYVDPDGNAWDLRVPPISDSDGIDIAPLQYNQAQFFASDNCSGEAYVQAYNPMTTVKLAGVDAIYVRPDTIAAESLTIGSQLHLQGDAVQCDAVIADVVVVPLSSMVEATQVPGFVMPVHLE